MTPEERDELRQTGDAMIAFADGEAVERNVGGWAPCLHPVWHPDRRYRRAPKPEPPKPWDCPDDVPGPVCWIRGDGILAMLITGFSANGTSVTLANQSNQYTWDQIRSRNLEYSTDRKTWKACVKEAR